VPPEAVWAALTEPGQVKNWLAEMSPQTFTDWHARYEELLPDYELAATP
jgi:uncharacterized protein YndB with AHSA1/START domain